MRRYAFQFRIRPQFKAEYKEAHDRIWPEMVTALRASGFRNYSIYFQPDGSLFGYFEAEDPLGALEAIAKTEVNARWQRAMDRFFVKEDPSTPGPEAETLEEVFHLD